MRRALVIAVLVVAASASDASAQIEVRCFAPALTTCSGIWHRSPLRIDWTITPPWQPVSGCVDETIPEDTPEVGRGCSVVNDVGEPATRGIKIKIDQTPPAVTSAAPSRAPDANGWYRSPLQISFTGTDATSGLLGCTSATYAGPDASAAAVNGTCTDRAGNVSPPTAFGLRYDSTPPSLASVRASAGDHFVRLRWAIPDATLVQVWRSPGRDGAAETRLNPGARGLTDNRVRNDRRYDYRVVAVDQAGNAAAGVFSAVPGPRLIAPAFGATAGAPPLLRWTEVRGARYYNVQLLRRGRKILSAWPSRPRLQLEQAWRFGGNRYRLRPGKYTWLVWPGRGPRWKNDYGPLIGRGKFTIAP